MKVFLDRPYLCPLCHRKVRQLYPVTRYDKKAGRWTNGMACLACCGPAEDERTSIGGPHRHRAIQR